MFPSFEFSGLPLLEGISADAGVVTIILGSCFEGSFYFLNLSSFGSDRSSSSRIFGEDELEFEDALALFAQLLFDLLSFFSFIVWFAAAAVASNDAFYSGEDEEFDCLDFIFLNISASEYGFFGFNNEVILSSGLCIFPAIITPRCYCC